jgi:site-specific recombinase XerD
LLNDYLQHLPVSSKQVQYRRAIRRFAVFISEHCPLNIEAIRTWLLACSKEASLGTTLKYAQWIDRYLSWLAAQAFIAVNPFGELRKDLGCRRTAPLARALLSENPADELKALRQLPLYGSHLGLFMRDHVARMRTLGYRYSHEYLFGQFDRFLQRRPDAEKETIATLIHEYAVQARSAYVKLQRFRLGRILAKALNRAGQNAELPKVDRVLVHEQKNKRCRPYIYSHEQIRCMLETARTFSSPYATFRPATLYVMVVLAYCAGLRVGEIVRLTLGDLDLENGAIDVRNTKFFKSRRLPVSMDALSVLREYVCARRMRGFPDTLESPLFWNERRPYSYITTEALLREVIRRAGLRKGNGRGGPRVHDLRHTFVVHRMSEWYRQGINPQDRLPYLAAYLGHRDINSSVIYITITHDLLQQACARVHSARGDVMSAIQEGFQ